MTTKTQERPLGAQERQQVEERTHELVTLLAEAMGDNDEACFQYPYADQVEEIERKSRDGFWAWTSGGHHVCLAAAISHHWGTGAAPAPIQPMIDAMDEIIAGEWKREFPERPSWQDCIGFWPDMHPDLFGGETPMARDIPETMQEEAREFEEAIWQEDTDCYYWKARAMIHGPSDRQNETGEWEVYIDAYLCSDTYGRDSISWLSAYGQKTDQTTGEFKRTIPLREFAAMDSDALEAIAAEAVAQLP